MSMKIGRGSPPATGSAGEAQGSGEAKGTTESKGPGFASKLEQIAPAGPVGGAGATERAPAATGRMTGDIGEKLAKNEITPETAIDQMLTRILDRQVGVGTPAAARSQVEAALRDAMESDPVLSAKVKSLSD